METTSLDGVRGVYPETDTKDGEEVTSPAVMSPTALPDVSELLYTDPDTSSQEEGGEDEAEDEWHDLEYELADLFQPGVRREAFIAFRGKLQDRLRAQLTPRRILVRDKIAFTVGTMDLFVSAYWLGARPSTFYKLYSIKVLLLLLIRWVYYRTKRWHYYMFDLCYVVQVILLLHLWVFPTSITLAKVSFAFAMGPLLWSILAFRNSLVYHSLDKVTSLFLHFFPACVVWANRFHPSETLQRAFAEDPAFAAHWESATSWELSVLPMAPYLVWSLLYGLKIFVISSKKIEQRQYETLFHYVTSRKGLFSTVVLRFSPRARPLAYLGLHMALTQTVMLLNTLWWSNRSAASMAIMAAFGLASWHGANFYFDVFAHRYVMGLGLERRRGASKTPPPVAALGIATETSSPKLK